MKKKFTLMKTLTGVCATLMSAATYGQFTETMGTTGASTETIAVHEANNRFSVLNLTYSGTADVRTTTPSTGYTGASGSYNVLVQSLETFQIQSIDASGCSVSDSLIFGVHKSTNASTITDFLVLEYSVNAGSSWTSISFAAAPTGTGTSKWYRRAVALPAGALSSTLWVRFRSTLTGGSSANPQFRIDDVQMTCGSTADCSGLEASAANLGNTVFCAGIESTDIAATTNITTPSYQWYNQDGIVVGQTADFITVENSGTYYAVVTNADGCEVTTGEVYVLAYPQPEFCVTEVEACEDAVIQVCAAVNTGDLIISEYVEGSGFNKYLELFNGTCDDIDLSNYAVRAYHNGSNVPTFNIPLSGTLAEGDVFVVAHRDATAWGGTPNLLTDSLQFNGDDALVVYNTLTNTVADIFGSVGNDPGSAWRDTVSASPTLGWRTEDKTLIRKSCVYAGITVNPALSGIYGFPTLLTEWDTLTVNNTSDLGSHTFGASAYDFAVVSGATTIISETDNCAQVRVGDGTSVLSVNAAFCGFNECGVAVNAITVIDNCGLRSSQVSNQMDAMNAEVFPNPFNDKATVVVDLKEEGMVAITVTDLAGHVVFTQAVKAQAGEQRIELNTASLAAGTYVCNIATDNGMSTVRIVKSN